MAARRTNDTILAEISHIHQLLMNSLMTCREPLLKDVVEVGILGIIVVEIYVGFEDAIPWG